MFICILQVFAHNVFGSYSKMLTQRGNFLRSIAQRIYKLVK